MSKEDMMECELNGIFSEISDDLAYECSFSGRDYKVISSV